MSLQRRLLLYLLLCAPIVWALALVVSVQRARHEVNELFDTEIVQLARQVHATLAGLHPAGRAPPAVGTTGDADLDELAVAVWDAEGRLLLGDREGVRLPRRPEATGFVDLTLEGKRWRVYYLQAAGEWRVAAGQRVVERNTLVWNLVASQLLPWLLVLPLLMVTMAWAVRRALAPVHALSADLARRGADELQPVPHADAPAELRPLLVAMNGMFVRVEQLLTRERRFTADAAHELRTPLAVLRAQWDVLRRAEGDAERRQAEAKLSAGLERMDRLVTQMLALSRLEATDRLPHATPVDWPSLVGQVVSDLLPLAERRHIELACDWPAPGVPPFALQGQPELLEVLLRNLLDNALRYAPQRSVVTLRFAADRLTVDNDGPPLSDEVRARLGERFHRRDGHAENGSGLGVSIAQRVARLHGLALSYRTRADGRGVVAEVGPT